MNIVVGPIQSSFRSITGRVSILLLLFALPLSSFATTAATVTSPFLYTFNADGILYEAGSESESTSPYFWLNSGAKLIIKSGTGRTIEGALSANDPRRLLYAKMNSLDTTNGYYPQNTFRLISRSVWKDADTSLAFKITETNLTDTVNRDEYSGIFLMGRYKDQDNLYYAGIRHDGLAVLKKKIGGTYHTLAYKQVFGTASEYDRMTNPNLMPENVWMGLRTKFTNKPDGSVNVELFLDKNNTKNWTSVVSFTDTGVGGPAFTSAGKLGIRTDYMDVSFDNWSIK